MIEAIIHRFFKPAADMTRQEEWDARNARAAAWRKIKDHPLAKIARYTLNMTVFTVCVIGMFFGLAMGLYGAFELKSIWACLGGVFSLIISVAVLFWYMEDVM